MSTTRKVLTAALLALVLLVGCSGGHGTSTPTSDNEGNESSLGETFSKDDVNSKRQSDSDQSSTSVDAKSSDDKESSPDDKPSSTTQDASLFSLIDVLEYDGNSVESFMTDTFGDSHLDRGYATNLSDDEDRKALMIQGTNYVSDGNTTIGLMLEVQAKADSEFASSDGFAAAYDDSSNRRFVTGAYYSNEDTTGAIDEACKLYGLSEGYGPNTFDDGSTQYSFHRFDMNGKKYMWLVIAAESNSDEGKTFVNVIVGEGMDVLMYLKS